MLEKISEITDAITKKIYEWFDFFFRSGSALRKPGRLIIDFDYFDSSFKHIKVEVYDCLSSRFVECSYIKASETFKWRRYSISLELNGRNFQCGPDFLIRLTRPRIEGCVQPFMIAGIYLKASAERESDNRASVVASFNTSNGGFNKSGFIGPYINSRKTVFMIGDFDGGRAYAVFDSIKTRLESAGFSSERCGAGKNSGIFESFIGRRFHEDDVSEKCLSDSVFFHDEILNVSPCESSLTLQAGAGLEKVEEDVCPVSKIAIESAEVETASAVLQPSEFPDDQPDHEIFQDDSAVPARPEVENGSLNNEVIGREGELTREKPARDYFKLRFFSSDRWEELVKSVNPWFVKRIMNKADGIMESEYEINDFYYKLNEDINWHNDFNYSNWPADEGYKSMSSRFYDCLRGGSINKEDGVWPASIQFAKNNEWVYLALAYKLSGKEKYARKVASLFKSFKAGNEIGFGINFFSISVCAERLLSWLMTFELLEDVADDLFDGTEFYDYFNRQFDFAYERIINRPREHERHERITALACLYGIMLQIGGRSAPAVVKAYKKLKEELAFQINPDGAHISMSPVVTLSIYKAIIYAMIISRKAVLMAGPSSSGDFVFCDEEFRDTLGRIGAFLSFMAAPDGCLYNISDYYSFFFMPFDECSSVDIVPSLQAASYLLMDGGLKFLTAEHKIAEIAMIFGTQGVGAYNELPVNAPETLHSYFKESGYFCVNGHIDPFGDKNRSLRLIFNTGAPSTVKDMEKFSFFLHNDIFNIAISSDGVNFISDSGPALFVKNRKIADYKKNLSAHGGIVVNKTFFEAVSVSAARTGFKYCENGGAYFVTCTHDAYQSVGIDASVRRSILMINGDYILIMDDIFNSRKKSLYLDVDISFHAPPEIVIESAGPNYRNMLIFNSRRRESKMVLLNHCSQKIVSSVHRASLEPLAGWHSFMASQLNESSTLIQSARFTKMPLRVYNLLCFVRSDEAVSSIVKNLKMSYNKINSCIEICHRNFKDSIKVNEKYEVDFQRVKI